ncbi:MAG: hypothetical protein IJS20_01050 [Bacteroidales bacterium]|nr:hypothetical protein [Bacteroidales bacterium]
MKFRIKHLTLATIIAIGGVAAYVSNTTSAHKGSNKSLLTENIEALSQSPEGGGVSSTTIQGIPGRKYWAQGAGTTDVPEKHELVLDANVQPQASLPGGWKLLSNIASVGGKIHVTYTRTVKKHLYQNFQRLACGSTIDPSRRCPMSFVTSEADSVGTKYLEPPTWPLEPRFEEG